MTHEKNEPEDQNKDPNQTGVDGDATLTEENDPFLQQAFNTLPEVQPSFDFLPRVMSTVYTHHLRTIISLTHVLFISFTLIITSLLFFIWDIIDYQNTHNIETFGRTFSLKLDFFAMEADQSFFNMIGILTAIWQWVSGVTDLAFTGTNFLVIMLLIVFFLFLAFLIKKVLQTIHTSK